MSKKIQITEHGTEVTDAFRIFINQFETHNLEWVLAKLFGTIAMALIMGKDKQLPRMLLDMAEKQLAPKDDANGATTH